MNDPDAPPAEQNRDHVYWHSAALFISDNVATQIDGLAHITAGPDYHWYNGFKESDWGGDWGPRKCDASTIPPIVARGVLIDVAAFKKVDALPGHTLISTKDLQDTLAWEGVTPRARATWSWSAPAPARYWGEDGADHAKIAEHDSAGPDLAATRWLVEDQGAIMVGSDTSGYEVNPAARLARTPASPSIATCSSSRASTWASSTTSKGSSQAKAYTFCYVAAVNKIKGTAAGFALRPLALR